MILLFGEKALKANATRKNTNIKNHPVESSGILARGTMTRGLLDANEYDTYMFSQQAEIDYSQYSENESSIASVGFMSEFSEAISLLGDCSIPTASFSTDCGGSSGSFTSFC